MEHCGGAHEGNFVHSLTLTDMHSGWTECAALVVREQTLVVEAISLIRRQLPFALRGLEPPKMQTERNLQNSRLNPEESTSPVDLGGQIPAKCALSTQLKGESRKLKTGWRRGADSNPRY